MNSQYVCRRCVAGGATSPFKTFYRSITVPTINIIAGRKPRRGRPDYLKRFSKDEKAEASNEYLKKLTFNQFNHYGDTLPPTPEQLEYARQFFASSKHSPIHLWTSDLFRNIPVSEIPEVVLMGRSNVGKSSLVNALVGSAAAFVSGKPGRTKEFHAYGVGGQKHGDSKLSIVDIPGYGKGSQVAWGEEIIKYIEGRKQLRRVFLLVDAKHGLKPSDQGLIAMLRERGISHQVLLTKLDSVFIKGSMKKSRGFHPGRLGDLEDARELLKKRLGEVPSGPGGLDDILACCTKMPNTALRTRSLGLDPVRYAVLVAAGLDPPQSDVPSQYGKPGKQQDSKGGPERMVLRKMVSK